MAFNLKEYILFREEIKRELFNVEVDENFKAVSNPWVDYRRYEIGQIVYHPIIIEPGTGEVDPTGGGEEHLTWWRANTRTTYGVFDMTQWDIIGGIAGFTDITIAGSAGYGKIVANWDAPITLPWNTALNGLIEASSPNDTFRLVAGTGIGISWNAAQDAILIENLGATAEINHGINIGSLPGVNYTGTAGSYSGMSGGSPNNLQFRGIWVINTGIEVAPGPLTALELPTNLEFTFDPSLIHLSELSFGCPLLNEICDVTYVTPIPTAGEILQYDGSDWINVPLSTIGSTNIYETSTSFTAGVRTATLFAGGGMLRFGANASASGFAIDNTGEHFTFGQNSLALPGYLVDFNANDTLDFQLRLSQATATENAAIVLTTTTTDFIFGINGAIDAFTINGPGATSFGGLAIDAFSIDSSSRIWIPDWAPTGAATLNQNYIPFASDDGTNTGLTNTDEGLLWTYDGTDGTHSNAKQLFVNLDALGGLPPPSTHKSGLFVTSVPNEDLTINNCAIYAYGRNHSPGNTGEPQSVVAVFGSIVDMQSSDTLLNAVLGRWDDGFDSLYGFLSAPTSLGPETLYVGFANNGESVADTQIGLGSIITTSSSFINMFGVYADVIDAYTDSSSGFSEITDTGVWAGFFRGCVNITEGGLVLGESATMPDCNQVSGDNIEDRTLWIKSTNGHLYRGDVDLEVQASSITLCEISDVDCSTPFTPENGDMLVYNSSTFMWEVTDPTFIVNNIYTIDGTLLGDRILSGDNNNLTFTNLANFTTSANNGQSHTASGAAGFDIISIFDIDLMSGRAITLDTAGSFPGSNILLNTADGSITLDANGATGQIYIDAEQQMFIDAVMDITITTSDSTANIELTSADEIITSSFRSTSIYAGDTADGGFIYLDTVLQAGSDIQVDSARAIYLNAVTAVSPDAQIILTANDVVTLKVIGSQDSDYISIETFRWTSGAAPDGTPDYGPPLIRWSNAYGTQTTEYVDWRIPMDKGVYQDILAMKADLTGVEWINPAALTITELCGYDVECVTPGPEGGDMLIFNGTTFTWTTAPAPAGIVTIYTGDASLLNDRTVDLDGNSLTFTHATCGPGLDILTLDIPCSPGLEPVFGIGNLPTTGYRIPTTVGALGQILAVTGVGPGVNIVDWVDDSVFTLCDAPVDCPTGGPQDGDSLVYDSATGMWEVVTPGGFWEEAGSTLNSLIDIKGTYTVTGQVDLSIIAGGTGHTMAQTGIIVAENNAIIGGNTNTVSDSANSIIGGGDGSSIVKDSDGSAIIGAATSEIHKSTNSAVVGGTNNDIGDTGVTSLEVHNSVILGGTGHDMPATASDTVIQSAIIGGDTGIIEGVENSAILGGNINTITIDANRGAIVGGFTNTLDGSGNCFIGGGSTNEINTGAHGGGILGGSGNTIVTGRNCAIVGGQNADVGTGQRSVVIGGFDNTVTHINSVAIGGDTLVSLADDTVYVPNLNINDTPATEPIAGLGLDVDNNVVLTGIAGEEICGALIDCPTGGPVAGDGLVFDGTNWVLQAGGAGFWEERGSTNNCLVDTHGTYTVGVVVSANDYSMIAGGNLHELLQTTQCIITGGLSNDIEANTNSGIVAGSGNSMITSGDQNFIGGGFNSLINGAGHAAMIGGDENSILGSGHSAIISGEEHDIQDGATHSVIVGGFTNLIDSSTTSTILGGQDNKIENESHKSGILGGSGSEIGTTSASVHGVIAGGLQHTIDTGAERAFIGGGSDNSIVVTSLDSAIIAGTDSIINNSSLRSAIIASGSLTHPSTITKGINSVIIGGEDMLIGGTPNSTDFCALVGGHNNSIVSADGVSSVDSVIVGGNTNDMTEKSRSVILGGTGITALNDDTVYVPNFNIETVGVTLATTILAVDGSGNVVDGAALLPSPGGDGIYGGSGLTQAGVTTATITDTLIFAKGTGVGTIEIEENVGIGTAPTASTLLSILADGSATEVFGINVTIPTGSITTDNVAIAGFNNDNNATGVHSIGVHGRAAPAAPVSQGYLGGHFYYGPSNGNLPVMTNTGVGLWAMAGNDVDPHVGAAGQDIIALAGTVGGSIADAYGLKVDFGGFQALTNTVGGELFGIQSAIVLDSAGDDCAGNLYGITSSVRTGGLAEPLSGAQYGLVIDVLKADPGSASTQVGIFIDSIGLDGTDGGTLTNSYGLYMDATTETGGGTITNKYGIIQNGTTEINNLRGATTIIGGSYTSPPAGGWVAQLHVVGDSIFDQSLTDPDTDSRTNYPAQHMFTNNTDANTVSILGGGFPQTTLATTLVLGQEDTGSAFQHLKLVTDCNGNGGGPFEVFMIDGAGTVHINDLTASSVGDVFTCTNTTTGAGEWAPANTQRLLPVVRTASIAASAFEMVIVDTGIGNIVTITLPLLSTMTDGDIIVVKWGKGSLTGVCRIQNDPVDFIDQVDWSGAAFLPVPSKYTSYEFIADVSEGNWWIK